MVVCIVSDGHQKINSWTLSIVTAISAYQEGVAKNVVNGKPVVAHIYEYTTPSAYHGCLLPHLSYFLCSLRYSIEQD